MGRLVAACEAAPVVLPIVHAGMERVMPRGASFPVPGQEVRRVVTAAVHVCRRHCTSRGVPGAAAAVVSGCVCSNCNTTTEYSRAHPVKVGDHEAKLRMTASDAVQVRILVGDPVPVADLLRRAALEQWPDARLYRSITARIADSLSALKVRLAMEQGQKLECSILTDLGQRGMN